MGRHHALKPHHLYLSPPQPSYSPASYYSSSTKFLHGTSVTALAVGDRIPGFKLSAAFLTSLQSNIFIDLDSCSNPNSGANTPDSLRPVASLPPPSPLAHAMASYTDKDLAPPAALNLPKPQISTNDEDEKPAKSSTKVDSNGIPELSTVPATDSDARAEALHMVADSVAQQRNIGSRTLIYHPITLAIFVAVFAALQRYFKTNGQTDYLKVCTTMTGVAMTIFVMVRWACSGYITEAEKVGTWMWLGRGRSEAEEAHYGLRVVGESDQVLLTQFGDEYIGTIIFRGVQPLSSSPSSPNKRSRKSHTTGGQTKMQIRAWTVGQKYRRKGVGAALLEEALKVGHEKGWTAGGVEFAEDHANSRRVLPAMLNGGFEKYDRVARKILDEKLGEFEAGLDTKGRRKR